MYDVTLRQQSGGSQVFHAVLFTRESTNEWVSEAVKRLDLPEEYCGQLTWCLDVIVLR